MKRAVTIAATGLVVLIIAASIAAGTDEYILRGRALTIGYKTPVSFGAKDFAGFYYDINDNIGAERITLAQSDFSSSSATLSDQLDADGYRGIQYTTHAQDKNFGFKPWGEYKALGFLGEGYLAAYDDSKTIAMNETDEPVAYLYSASKDRDLMAKQFISKILIDDNSELTLTSTKPLNLGRVCNSMKKSIC